VTVSGTDRVAVAVAMVRLATVVTKVQGNTLYRECTITYLLTYLLTYPMVQNPS